MLSYFSTKCQCFFCTFCQNNMFAEIWFMSYDPKTSECRILSNAMSHKKIEVWRWIFGYDERSKEALSISWLLQMGVLRYAWTCSKWQQIVSFIPRMSWVMKFFARGKEAIEVTLSIFSSRSGQTCSKWFKRASQIFYI